MQTLITWLCIRTQVVGYDIMGPTLDPNTLCFFGSVRVRIRGPFSSLLSSRLIHPCPPPPLLQNLHTSIRGRLDSFSISSSPQLVQKNTKKKGREKKKPLLLMALSNPFLFSPRSVHKFNPLLLSHLPRRKPIPLISSHRVRRFAAPHWSLKRFNRKFSGVFAFSLLSFDLRFS